MTAQPTALGASEFVGGGGAAAHHSNPPRSPLPARALPSRLPLRFAERRGTRSMTLPSRAATDGSSTRPDGTLPPYEATGGASRLDETSFLASLMPKKEIGADRFLEAHPERDGRGVLIAIFDSGVDPAAAGLQVTSDGKPKIVDILDCTGSGDVDTSEVVRADGDGCIKGKSGRTLVINPSWANPTGAWHVGRKLVYELFTEKLTDRLKKERKKKWDENNQELMSGTLKLLNEFDKADNDLEEMSAKKARVDLENKLDFLKKQAMNYDDKGPIIDVVVWNDGNFWRVALDTQNLEDDAEKGKLADFLPMTNYSIERKYGVFSKLDACSFVTNIYDNGNLVSLVTDCSPHGTHVAGIAAAYHPEGPVLNGVAPGAQLISCKIGDSRLGSKLTGTGLTRALIAAVKHKCDVINMSYGGSTIVPDYGRFIELVNEVVDKHKLVFISSVGNDGPALSTVRSPGGTTSSIIGVGAYVSLAMAAGAHCVVDPPFEGLEYTWSSRGPTVDGDLGVCLSAPGGAMAPVPTWTLQRRMLRNGTSMSSPSACGGVALLISALKGEGIDVSPYSIRKALENTSDSIGISQEDKLSTGQGLMQIDRALDYLLQSKNLPCICYKLKITQSGKGAPAWRGIYLRESSSCQRTSELNGDKHNYGSTSSKSAPEHINEQVRDAKIRFLSRMKLNSNEERVAWNDLCSSLKLEYPGYTPLLSMILRCLVSGGGGDSNNYNREIVNTADEIVDSIDRYELAEYFSKRYDPDGTSEEIKKRMERMHEREQLVDALYQKAMALGNIELLKTNLPSERKESDETIGGYVLPPDDLPNPFETNLKELKKWVDVKSGKFAMLLAMYEKMNGRLGTALKVLNDMIQEDPSPSRKLYNLKIQLLNEIGWDHIASYEKQWMQVRFPPCLPPL